MNSNSQEYARMQKIAAKIGYPLRNFVKNKKNVCIYALVKNRPQEDLFTPCIYSFNFGRINSKQVTVVDNRTWDLKNLKNKYDGIIIFKCIENQPIRTMDWEISRGGEFKITYSLTNDKFEDDDEFMGLYYELGFDR